MAISARIPANLDTNKLIPELFGKNVLKALKSQLVVVPVVNHSYEAELVKGDTLYIPQSANVTATEVTIGTEGVMQDPTTTHIPLSIDQYWEALVPVDYMSRRQSQVNLVGLAEEESAYALRKKIDSTLCALFYLLGGSTVYGTAATAWNDDLLIAAVEKLDEAEAPEKNRVWIGDPSVKADIMKIDKFTRSDYFAGDAVPSGGFRKDIYGAPLLTTNNLMAYSTTANYGVYMHKDALAIVISENLHVDRVEQPLRHQIVINTTALWGVGELRDTFGYCMYTRTQ